MIITAARSQSLASELQRLLPDVRALIGPGRRCTLVFDRGGYSPAVITETIASGFDLLTYDKGSWPRAAVKDVTTVDYQAPDGSKHTYQLAEQQIVLPVPGRRTVTLRSNICRSADGHQIPILTNRTDLTLAQVAYRMGNRWRQENYFNCADLRVMPTAA